MSKLFFDIETIPAEEGKHEILKAIHKKGLEDGKKLPETSEEYIRNTTFNGAYGRIACISYAFDDGPTSSLSGDEKKILTDFWALARRATLFVGFNIMDFDLVFILQRSIILGIRPSVELNFARFRNNPIFDVMQEWTKWSYQNKISLDSLAKALDIPSSKGGAIEGKDVAQAFKDGRIAEICKYCEDDVDVTRKIYKRMTFETGPTKGNELPF